MKKAYRKLTDEKRDRIYEEYKRTGELYRTAYTVLNFDRPTKNKEHPTMKPVALFDYQIKNNTKGGDNVLDLFGGSGTTIMACEQNGRNAFVMEYDPRYVDVVINRWEAFTGEKAEKLN